MQKGADQEPSKTLDDAIQGFLSTKTSLKEFALTNYSRQLENQVTEVIPATTPIRELEWDNGGREKVRALRTHIEDKGSHEPAFRVQKVLAQALGYAILQGWLRRRRVRLVPLKHGSRSRSAQDRCWRLEHGLTTESAITFVRLTR